MFKHSTLLVSVLALAGILAAIAAAAPKQASLVIRHQIRGCHSWSLNRGAYAPSQSLTLARGGSISVTNNDVMPHQLVERRAARQRRSAVSQAEWDGQGELLAVDARPHGFSVQDHLHEAWALSLHDEARRGLHEGDQDRR